MDVQADVKQETKNKSAADTVTGTKYGNSGVPVFSDQRPEAIAQRKLNQLITTSAQINQLRAHQAMLGNSAFQTGQQFTGTAPANDAGITYTMHTPEKHAFQKKADTTDAVVQQVTLPFKTPPAPRSVAEQAIIADANTLDGLTDAAYTNTTNRLQASVADDPVPLTRGMFPGITEGHFATMIQRLAEGDNALKAAAVGYAIEDQVSFSAAKPAAAETQVVLGGARPDFLITHGADAARRRGIVDITSTGQAGHVLDKDLNIAHFALVWESVYPSIDFDELITGPVALAPATIEMVTRIKRRKANEYVWGELYGMRRRIELYSQGIMQGNEQFRKRADLLLRFMNTLPDNVVWSGIFTGTTNTYIRQVNELLEDPDFHLRTLDAIAASARAKYGVADGPLWP